MVRMYQAAAQRGAGKRAIQERGRARRARGRDMPYTSSVREETPALRKTATRWLRAVLGEIRRSAAICAFWKPRATSRATSRSRDESDHAAAHHSDAPGAPGIALAPDAKSASASFIAGTSDASRSTSLTR